MERSPPKRVTWLFSRGSHCCRKFGVLVSLENQTYFLFRSSAQDPARPLSPCSG